jgi:capsular polysaccharide biosynthesis protein
MPETQRSSLRPPLASFLPVARRWRWMLLAAAVAAGVAGYVTAAGSGRAYESRADILVGSVNSGDNDDLQASGRAAQTYAELATTRALLQATEDRLRISNISGDVTVTANATTRILTIAVRNADARLARDIANTHAQELVGFAARRRTAPDEPGSLQIVDPAVISASPVGPDPVTVAILAAIAGLIGALALALLLDRSGDAVREAADLEEAASVPCLATLSRGALRPVRFSRGGDAVGVRGEAAGAYRMLAAKVEILAGPGLVIVTLGRSGGIVAVNLATAMAATGARVAVVDAEGTDSAIAAVRDPQTAAAALAEGSGSGSGRVSGSGGGSRSGRSSSEGSGAVPDRVHVAAAPAVEEAARDGAEGAGRLMAELLDEGDAVIVHAPPFQRSPLGLAWARVAEGTILVAERERTTQRELVSALESLRLVDARLVGTILTAPAPGLRG